MNIIVANKYRELINNTNIDVMKEMSGVFEVDDLVRQIQSLFYKKIIIDATALNNFPKSDVLKKLASSLDTEKLILFLPPDNPPPSKFLEFLVEIKIYNFTDNINGLRELLNSNNTYEDVSQYNHFNEEKNDDFSDMNFNLDSEMPKVNNGKIVLGIKNVTNQAGSTSLIYMLKKNLEEKHNKKVVALEINKNDFNYFQATNMYSLKTNQVDDFLKNMLDKDIILIDLSDNDFEKYCSDILYLVEPSMYKINELLFQDRMALGNLKGKKVILNKSLLSPSDVNIFSREAELSIYFNLPPLNDRVLNPSLDDLLSKLGLIIDENNIKPKKSLLDFFK